MFGNFNQFGKFNKIGKFYQFCRQVSLAALTNLSSFTSFAGRQVSKVWQVLPILQARGKYIFEIRPVRRGPYIENSHLDEGHILKIPI